MASCTFQENVSFLDGWNFVTRLRNIAEEDKWALTQDAMCLAGSAINVLKNGGGFPFFEEPEGLTLEVAVDRLEAAIPAEVKAPQDHDGDADGAQPAEMDPATIMLLISVISQLFGGSVLDFIKRLFS